MEKFNSLIIGILLLSSVSSMGQPILSFEQDTVDVDTVYVDEDLKVTYPFMNIGDEPLVIYTCRGSGKGLGEYSKSLIQPGKTDTIKAIYYNIKGEGEFLESLTLTGNFEGGIKRIFIIGFRRKREK